MRDPCAAVMIPNRTHAPGHQSGAAGGERPRKRQHPGGEPVGGCPASARRPDANRASRPYSAFLTRAFQVPAPTMPSGLSRYLSWNHRTALSVRLPKTPSTVRR
jgi:hypothetical protein